MQAQWAKNTYFVAACAALLGFGLAACLICVQPLHAFADEETETALEQEESSDLPAWALEDEDIQVFRNHISEAKQGVVAAEEELAASEANAEEAKLRVEELQSQIEDTKGTIQEVGGQLAGQKQKSANALKLQYMLDAAGFNLTDFLLSSTTLNDFVRNLEYMDHVQELNLTEIGRYADLKAQYEQAQKELEAKEAAAAEEQRVADAKVDASKTSLDEAKAAQATAEEELAAEISARQKALEATGTIDDNVNWDLSKEDFIKEWGTRIDAYLAGSALAGNGEVFAEAAWDNHIDPRWSPAISCVESGKGRSCFLPHNAWGWGQSSWSSWPEAIKAHVAGLAKGYGYSVTLDKAMKYCPPNAQEWYVQCVGEMRRI